MVKANKEGYDQILWADSDSQKLVEELSVMNFFAVYGQKVKTPPLTDTILDGVTRRSILELANYLGYRAEEEEISIRELVSDIEKGKCSEMFSCGTAVIIIPIKTVGYKGVDYTLKNLDFTVAMKLKDKLLSLQQGLDKDPFGWRIKV